MFVVLTDTLQYFDQKKPVQEVKNEQIFFFTSRTHAGNFAATGTR